MERKEGYYWVKMHGKDIIARYYFRPTYPKGYYWSWDGRAYSESDFEEIDERPIIRHDQLPETFDIKKGMGFERHLLEISMLLYLHYLSLVKH